MKLRFILFPFALLYDIITRLRNGFFNYSIFSTQSHNVKTIVVGNLSVGGTGKSPFVLYLMSFLSHNKEIAVISRGYGRKTKGFYWVDTESKSEEVGDEPLMFYQFASEKNHIAVCEDRNEGIFQLTQKFPNTDCVLLDDAYQHRKLKAGFNILLTTFKNPFFTDFLLPVGNLREGRYAANRSDVIIVTKCPIDMKMSEKEEYIRILQKYNKPVFFSQIVYAELKSFTIQLESIQSVLVVAGIANPNNMLEYLHVKYKVESILFSDHHAYSEQDIRKIHQKFDTFASNRKVIVTTIKDYMRLKDKIVDWGLNNYPWYVLPISIKIDREQDFIKLIENYVGKN